MTMSQSATSDQAAWPRGYEDAMALARVMARERDERFEQLKAAEAERDRYARALAEIADYDPSKTRAIDVIQRLAHLRRVATEALRDA